MIDGDKILDIDDVWQVYRSCKDVRTKAEETCSDLEDKYDKALSNYEEIRKKNILKIRLLDIRRNRLLDIVNGLNCKGDNVVTLNVDEPDMDDVRLEIINCMSKQAQLSMQMQRAKYRSNDLLLSLENAKKNLEIANDICTLANINYQMLADIMDDDDF